MPPNRLIIDINLKFYIVIYCSMVILSCSKEHTDYSKWTNYAGTKDGARYSSLKSITIDNVTDLKIAWEYECGDGTETSQIQCQPIVVGNVLYGTTPALNLFAINAETGKEIWRFNPFDILGGVNSWAGTNRGSDLL